MIKNSLILFVAFLAVSCSKHWQEFPALNMSYQTSKTIKERLEQDTVPWKDQIAAFDYSVIGNYQASLESWDHPEWRDFLGGYRR